MKDTKQRLFEVMHKVGKMPLNEDIQSWLNKGAPTTPLSNFNKKIEPVEDTEMQTVFKRGGDIQKMYQYENEFDKLKNDVTNILKTGNNLQAAAYLKKFLNIDLKTANELIQDFPNNDFWEGHGIKKYSGTQTYDEYLKYRKDNNIDV